MWTRSCHGPSYDLDDLVRRSGVASHGLLPEGYLERVESFTFQPPVVLDVLLQLECQRIVHQAVNGSPVRITQLIGDLLIAQSLGGQLDRAGSTGRGQRTVTMLAADRRQGCRDRHASHCQAPGDTDE